MARSALTTGGEKVYRQFVGQIVDGVLITEPIAEMIMPWQNLSVPSVRVFKDARFQLDLSSGQATGVLFAGYADVDTWYYQLIRNDSTHHLSNGQIRHLSVQGAQTSC